MTGQDILLKRKALRVNQEPVARALGIDPMVLRHAEDGRWQPAEEEIRRAIQVIESIAQDREIDAAFRRGLEVDVDRVREEVAA